MISATEWYMSEVFASCITWPLTTHRIASGSSPISSGVTSAGPTGQNVSSDLPRAHCRSPNWRSRADTSFTQVYPAT
jgi:hypothetical protein